MIKGYIEHTLTVYTVEILIELSSELGAHLDSILGEFFSLLLHFFDIFIN